MHFCRTRNRLPAFGPAAVAVVFLIGCGGSGIPDSKTTYVGAWEGEGTSLLIMADGSVEYERVSSGSNASISAPVKGFHGDDFEVGVLFLTTEFAVQQAPYLDGNQWKMTVDGVGLTRIDVTGMEALAQVMPDHDELVALTNSAMDQFAAAVKTKDFTALHQSIAEIWRDQITAADLAGYFPGFVNGEFDLTQVSSHIPEFTGDPSIDENGLIAIEGSYPADPPVGFKFTYRYRSPDWKLVGLTVHAR